MIEIKSNYGPPFDNPEWEERKEEIKKFLESDWWNDGAQTYVVNMLQDLWVALEAEESDSAMWGIHLATIYDYVTGGLVSKPNTLPSEVIAIMEQRFNESYQEGYDEGQSDLLYEHFGGTLPA